MIRACALCWWCLCVFLVGVVGVSAASALPFNPAIDFAPVLSESDSPTVGCGRLTGAAEQ